MRDRLGLLAYLAALVLFTTLHEPVVLGAGLAGVLLLAGRRALSVLRRAVLAVLLFNSVVTLSYLALATWRGDLSWHYVLLLNLRVLLLTATTFVLMQRINLFRALAFSSTLSYLLTLSYSQALTLERVLAEFRQALRSRTLGRLGRRAIVRHRAALGGYLMAKSLHDAGEIAGAMRSRGFFND